MISVTAVRISPDLAYANIYVSIFPVKEPLDALDKVKSNVHLLEKN